MIIWYQNDKQVFFVSPKYFFVQTMKIVEVYGGEMAVMCIHTLIRSHCTK